MSRERQKGFGLIAAIVILVILASLSVFITTLSTTQSANSALDTMGTRAFFAAQSGVEWGVYQTLKGTAPPCAASPGINTALGRIDGITVTVNCSAVIVDEAGANSLYVVTALACNESVCPSASPGAFYVERKVSALTGT
jgi:MSHA biogenesis protein MshP